MCVFYYQKCDGIWVKVSLCTIRIKRICRTSNLDSDKWIFDFYYFPQSHSLYSPLKSLCNLQTLTFSKSVYNWLPKKKQLKIKLKSSSLKIPVGILSYESITTLFEIFIFCPKIQLWLHDKIAALTGWKTRENVVVLDF